MIRQVVFDDATSVPTCVNIGAVVKSIYTHGPHVCVARESSTIHVLGEASLEITADAPDGTINLLCTHQAYVEIKGICDTLVVQRASGISVVHAYGLRARHVHVMTVADGAVVSVWHPRARVDRIGAVAVVQVMGGVLERNPAHEGMLVVRDPD